MGKIKNGERSRGEYVTGRICPRENVKKKCSRGNKTDQNIPSFPLRKTIPFNSLFPLKKSLALFPLHHPSPPPPPHSIQNSPFTTLLSFPKTAFSFFAFFCLLFRVLLLHHLSPPSRTITLPPPAALSFTSQP